MKYPEENQQICITNELAFLTSCWKLLLLLIKFITSSQFACDKEKNCLVLSGFFKLISREFS